MEAKAPNPGSDDAIEQGCRCPVMDNAHGHGYLGVAGTFVYSASCEMHWRQWRQGEEE